MKKRFLPIGLFSLFILGLALIFLIPSGQKNKEINQDESGAQTIAGAKAYLASIRNNQHTGVLDPKDVIESRQQFESLAEFKSSSAKEYNWVELGPDNMGGRTRALIFDSRDDLSKTLYAASVTGGIFKSTNIGSTWNKVNNSSTANLNATCMVQDEDGTIYVGTGEGLGSENYSAYGELGYDGGFVGKGIYKSDADDKFAYVEGTKPAIQGDVTEWAYINELAIDKSGNKLYAATHTGLKYAGLPALDNWSSDVKYKLDSSIIYRTISLDSIVSCDSFEVVDGEYVLYGSSGWVIAEIANDTSNIESLFNEFVPVSEPDNCYDVKVNNEGVIYTVIYNRVYVSETGEPTEFENRSVYPENPDYVRMDMIDRSSTVTIKNKEGVVLHEASSSSFEEVGWHTDYVYTVVTNLMEYPASEDAGRIEFAIAPSASNVVYAMAAKGSNPNRNSLLAIYRTEDNGRSWSIVAPGGSASLNILGSVYGNSNTKYYQGDYCNTITVYPNNPYKIVAGGINLWTGEKVNETGYYQWNQKSEGRAPYAGGIYSPYYCHADHHAYVFRPTNGNQVFLATDGGVYLANISGTEMAFQAINKNFNAAQFYSVDVTTTKNEFLGGAQDIGTVYVSGSAGTGGSGEDIYRQLSFPAAFPEGTDGGSVAFSTLGFTAADGEVIPPPIFYAKGPHPQNQNLQTRSRRSETLGFDYSLQFLSGDITDDRFITPMLLWESYNNENSQVYVTWFADKDYEAGDPIRVRSANYRYPFNYILEEAISEGDSLMVKDIVTNRLFIATEDEVYMTLESAQFALNPEWFLISHDNHAGFEGTAQSMGYSFDANYLWVGSDDGRLFRVSNIANAFEENEADVNSSNCIIATTEVILPGEITQAVTSVSVDPKDPNKVLITLGNYGNDDYVFYCTNGTDDTPEFESVQGNLPIMPVYSSFLELDEATDMAIIGTDMGVWASDDPDSKEWYNISEAIGEIPVLALRQQEIYKGSYTITYFDPSTGQPSYEVYPKIKNYGDIYVATHGRGVFRMDMNYVGVEENPAVENNVQNLSFNLYPNPAVDDVTVNIDLPSSQDVLIDIYDLSGKRIMSQKFSNLPSGHQDVEFNISTLNEGTYLMQITSAGITGAKKLIVAK